MLFKLTKDQTEKFNKWYQKLPKHYCGAIGGRITFKFTPTGLGEIIKVEDTYTKKEIDLTNYENW